MWNMAALQGSTFIWGIIKDVLAVLKTIHFTQVSDIQNTSYFCFSAYRNDTVIWNNAVPNKPICSKNHLPFIMENKNCWLTETCCGGCNYTPKFSKKCVILLQKLLLTDGKWS